MIKRAIHKIKDNGIVINIYRNSYSLLISLFIKKISKKYFSENYQQMKNLYINNIKKYDFIDYILPQWEKNTFEIEKLFLNKFSFSFLKYDVIGKTMFLYTFRGWKNIQKKLIAEYFTVNEARKILREYNVGRPLLNDMEYLTSGNSIHHLYHLVKFFKETDTKPTNLNTIVEVGGGYGNLAKIFKKINKKSTYIIIDIPIFSYIQAVYLKTIFGNEMINIVDGKNTKIKNGLINLIPLDKNKKDLINNEIKDVDIFISTWALSESNENMQNYVKDVDYFGAKYLLLAYQKSRKEEFAFAENIKNVTRSYDKIFNEETEYSQENYYLFCKRNKKNV